MKSKSVLTGLLASLLAATSLAAWSGSFSVSPVRFYMAPKDRATSVTITNTGDQELVMQADIYSWKQKPDGEDELTLTEDLFLSPPIIKLAAGARQVVRLARLVAARPTEQLTYRMIVREIPEAIPPKEGVSVQLALAFSLPIFITPKGVKSQLGCQVERTAANSAKAICDNSGNAYVLMGEMLLKNAAGENMASSDSLGYILPGVKRSFELKKKEGKIPSGKARLEVALDDGTTAGFDINLPD